MKAIASKRSLPTIYKRAIEDTLKEKQTEVAKRLVLCACLVGSDAFGWGQDECNKFKRHFESIIHGYAEDVYNFKDKGDIKDMRDAMEEELHSRDIYLEPWAE